jgi:hypothetical protein
VAYYLDIRKVYLVSPFPRPFSVHAMFFLCAGVFFFDKVCSGVCVIQVRMTCRLVIHVDESFLLCSFVADEHCCLLNLHWVICLFVASHRVQAI